MPGITLTLSGEPDQSLTDRLAREISDLTCRVLKKNIGQTSTVIRYEPRENWFIAGRSLTDHRKNAFRLEVTVTDETNTKTEKADFHRAAFELIASRVDDLHPHSSIHVVDCRGSAYGYGGMTQDARAHSVPGYQ